MFLPPPIEVRHKRDWTGKNAETTDELRGNKKRSGGNAVVRMLRGFVAFIFKKKKGKVNISRDQHKREGGRARGRANTLRNKLHSINHVPSVLRLSLAASKK